MKIGAHFTHPIADAFPLMEGAALADLVDDIKVNGLRVPIVLFQERGHGSGDVILDGRNRYRACLVAKVEPEFVIYDGPEDEESLVKYVVSVNMARRDMSADQRALVVRRLGTLLARAIKADRKRAKHQPSLPKVDEVTEEQLDAVAADGVPELEQAVASGEVDAHRAMQISALEPDAQRRVLEEIAKPEKAEPVRARKEPVTSLASLALDRSPTDAVAIKFALFKMDASPHGEGKRFAEIMRETWPWLPGAGK